MSNRTITLTNDIYSYLLTSSVREPPLLSRLRDETAKDTMARMQIAPEQGRFLALLVGLINARRCIEIGVFTGYSSLCIAEAMPDDGLLVACDINTNWTNTAKRYWQEAGVAGLVQLHLAPALETLNRLLSEGHTESFDFAFIDADKQQYVDYYECCLELLRPGGLIAVDNTLWGGSVADTSDQEPETVAIRRFNQHVLDDARVRLSMVPIGDGLTLAMKQVGAPNN